jgi:hypothetical protein
MEVSKASFFNAYVKFADENGFSTEHVATLGRRILHLLPSVTTVKRNGGTRYYRGIELRDSSAPPPMGTPPND